MMWPAVPNVFLMFLGLYCRNHSLWPVLAALSWTIAISALALAECAQLFSLIALSCTLKSSSSMFTWSTRESYHLVVQMNKIYESFWQFRVHIFWSHHLNCSRWQNARFACVNLSYEALSSLRCIAKSRFACLCDLPQHAAVRSRWLSALQLIQLYIHTIKFPKCSAMHVGIH
jgi:hypothetical protein